MSKYQQVLDNNRQWAADMAKQPAYFERLSAGQKPAFLYIGCADSRVPPNTVMGVEPGEVFVHRNVANVVVNTDLNIQSVIQYSLEVLKVEHVVVCGHTGCGGVAAAMGDQDLGPMNGWLSEIRDVYRLHRKELDAIEEQEARYRRLIELNVQEQCLRVMKTASWQREYAARKGPSVHGWVFDLHDGLIKDLEIPFEKLAAEFEGVYGIRP